MSDAYRLTFWLLGDHVKVIGQPGFSSFTGEVIGLSPDKVVVKDWSGEWHVIDRPNVYAYSTEG